MDDVRTTAHPAPPPRPPPHGPRKFDRYRVAAYADLTGDDVLLYHRIDDVSEGGMSYHAAKPLSVGSRVEAVLNFPQSGAVVWVTGRVSWVHGLHHGIRVGLEWLGLGAADRMELRRHLAEAKTGTVGQPLRVPYARKALQKQLPSWPLRGWPPEI